MSTPNWMMDGPAQAPQRAGMARRQNRRSTDRRIRLDAVLAAGFASLLALWGIGELIRIFFR
jgi:hypothetical protein